MQHYWICNTNDAATVCSFRSVFVLISCHNETTKMKTKRKEMTGNWTRGRAGCWSELSFVFGEAD